MIRAAVVKIVVICVDFRWIVIIAGVALMAGATIFDVARFSINTDVERLIFQELPWHQCQVALTQAFPQKGISAVVIAPTPENAEQATNELAQALTKNPELFPKVAQPDSGAFFSATGCCWPRRRTSNKPSTD